MGIIEEPKTAVDNIESPEFMFSTFLLWIVILGLAVLIGWVCS